MLCINYLYFAFDIPTGPVMGMTVMFFFTIILLLFIVVPIIATMRISFLIVGKYSFQ